MTFAKLEALRLGERIPDRQVKVQRRHEEALKNPEMQAWRCFASAAQSIHGHVATARKSAQLRRKRNVAQVSDLRFLTPKRMITGVHGV
ncbi:hypothetical protein [Ensifer adhaerens]|uniref:hypothetical protein n=1 Tax=Ensifer adhaerens TaxID=106592 RepID=UPI001319F791|nr:hypothetical protein [Ensifer adhaerens]